MLRPRPRHLLLAAALLVAIVLETTVGFVRFGAAGEARGGIMAATAVAIAATAGVGLFLFRMSVRQGRLEAEQLVAEERARSAHLVELGRLAAGIAHEVRNPLQGVNGYLALLEREPLDAEKRHAHVAAIRAALTRMEKVTRDLLDSVNPAPPHRVEVAPYELFKSFERSLGADARFAEIARRIETESGVPSVLADAAALEHVLLNLALNARDAMGGKGTLTLRARRGAEGAVDLEVEDEGPGIPADRRATLFEPFRSGRGSTGLGLWVCANLVRASGGTIRAGEISKGALFVVTLPVSR